MFAALHVPDFPSAAALRRHAAWRGQPCAVLAATRRAEADGRLPVASINAAARFAGVVAGWPLNRAWVRCPDLRVLPRDVEAEAAMRAELLCLAESLSPDVEATAEDVVIVDVSRRGRAIDESLAALAMDGAEVWHARAATPDLALLAVRHPHTRGRMVEPGDLAQLPLAALRPLAAGTDAWVLLESWGLQTLGDFMGLPRQALVERLGVDAGHWQDVVHGRVGRLLRLYRAPESLLERMDFEDEVRALEPLLFGLRRVLHTLGGRLAARHVAAGSVRLRLVLETGAEAGRRVALPEPQSSVAGMAGPLQAWLESLQLDAAVVAMEVAVEAAAGMAAQREWFGRELPQPQRWAETLARLEALLGPGRVGIPAPNASHAPDDFTLRPAAGPAPGAAARPNNPACPVPLHRFRPPLAVAVAHECAGRLPRPLALLSGAHAGPIRDLRGPFPSSGVWWDPAQAWQRLEWDIEAADHYLLRLVYQMPDRWHVEGFYP